MEAKIITLNIQGNVIDKNNNYYPAEVLEQAWKNCLGVKIQSEEYGNVIVKKVKRQDNFINIEMIKS